MSIKHLDHSRRLALGAASRTACVSSSAASSSASASRTAGDSPFGYSGRAVQEKHQIDWKPARSHLVQFPQITDAEDDACDDDDGVARHILLPYAISKTRREPGTITRILSTWTQTPFPTFPPHMALHGPLPSYPSPEGNHPRKLVPLHPSYSREPIGGNATSVVGLIHGGDLQDRDRRDRVFFRLLVYPTHQNRTRRPCSCPSGSQIK